LAVQGTPFLRHPGLDPGSSRLASARRDDSNHAGRRKKTSPGAQTRACWTPDQVRGDGGWSGRCGFRLRSTYNRHRSSEEEAGGSPRNNRDKSTPYLLLRKNPQNSFCISFTPCAPEAQFSRSALGYTARRCGEAGSALVGGRLRILLVIGVEQQSPRRQREEGDAVSDRPCRLPDARPGCVDGVVRLNHSLKLPFPVPGASSPGVPTAHRPLVERDHQGLKRKSGGTQEDAASAPPVG
jgi:hypothetical protein